MVNIAKWVRHNQGLFTSLIVSAVLLTYTVGCASKVTSLLESKKMVTAEELNLEIRNESARLALELEQLLERAELKKAELERQDAIKQKLMDFALIAAETGTLNPSGLVGLLFSVVGIGAVIDNRIKDKVIKNRPIKV